MSAISGTRRAIKELVDGTVRVQIDIDPQFRRQFFEMFPDIDMPVAIAPLGIGFDKFNKPAAPKGDTGANLHKKQTLSQYAAMLCGNPDFQRYLIQSHGFPAPDAPSAAEAMRTICSVESRAEFDTNTAAAENFHALREAYHAWLSEGQ